MGHMSPEQAPDPGVPVWAVLNPVAKRSALARHSLERACADAGLPAPRVLETTAAELIGVLPAAASVPEADYQAIVQSLCRQSADAAVKAAADRADMLEYYTLWAHQIKTPIAAMRLRLQSEDSDSSRRLLADLGRIEQYVEMVLTYLRLEGEGTDYVFREARLDDIVRPALRRFAGEFIARRLTLDPGGLNPPVPAFLPPVVSWPRRRPIRPHRAVRSSCLI